MIREDTKQHNQPGILAMIMKINIQKLEVAAKGKGANQTALMGRGQLFFYIETVLSHLMGLVWFGTFDAFIKVGKVPTCTEYQKLRI